MNTCCDGIGSTIKANNLYLDQKLIRSELHRRRSDNVLRQRMEEHLGEEILQLFSGSPKLVYSSYVVTPGHDVFHFLEGCNNLGLEPLFLETSDDKFTTQNLVKYLLGKMYFSDKETLASLANVPKANIIDYNVSDGINLREVKTIWGEGLVDFHKKLFRETFPELTGKVHDVSGWLFSSRYKSEYYYLYWLAPYIYHGVFFENIELEGREAEFSRTKTLPSFFKLKEMFGVAPMIHPAIPLESYDDYRWWCYPTSVRRLLPSHVLCK